MGLISSLAIMVFSLYFLINAAVYYVEIYRAIYGIKVSVVSISYVLNVDSKTAKINVILSIDNPSNHEVVITGGQGKMYLNQRFLGSFMIYVGEGLTIAPRMVNFTVTGIGVIEYPYFNILYNALNAGYLNWFVEAWVHLRIDSHVTVVKCVGVL